MTAFEAEVTGANIEEFNRKLSKKITRTKTKQRLFFRSKSKLSQSLEVPDSSPAKKSIIYSETESDLASIQKSNANRKGNATFVTQLENLDDSQ